ncbi:MAG: hypothetical protein LBW85_01415 [Deltaproteobacteria bacterium]|jgi:hypothetical protein|nr:hypothetical protein [Deltaproteobacteria bacterium]
MFTRDRDNGPLMELLVRFHEALAYEKSVRDGKEGGDVDTAVRLLNAVQVAAIKTDREASRLHYVQELGNDTEIAEQIRLHARLWLEAILLELADREMEKEGNP